VTFSLRNLAKRSIEIGFSQEQKNRLMRVLAPLARDQLDALAHQYSKSPHMKLGLEKLAARGLQPDCIVDIGAFEGGWSRITHEIWPGATQILIEGNAGKAAMLEAVARDLGGIS